MADARGESRRRFLGLWGLGVVGVLAQPRGARALPGARALALHNIHTGESIRAEYWVDDRYVPGALRQIDWLLRDYRTDEVREIDRRLLDLLGMLPYALETREPFEVISGYRSPATNAMLAATTNGVARSSLHVAGLAIDIRVPGRSLSALRDAARALGRGGVGYYPASNFVHVDVGRVRHW